MSSFGSDKFRKSSVTGMSETLKHLFFFLVILSITRLRHPRASLFTVLKEGAEVDFGLYKGLLLRDEPIPIVVK